MSSHLAENIQTQKLQQEAADKDAHITRLASELQNLDEEIGAQNQRLAQETADKNSHIERMTKVYKDLKGNVDQLSMHQNASKREINKLKLAQKTQCGGLLSDSTHGCAHVCGYILPRTLHIPPRTIPLHRIEHHISTRTAPSHSHNSPRSLPTAVTSLLHYYV